LGVDLKSRELDMIFRCYDTDKDGTIDYAEFIRLFGFKAGR
jgi:Ca2+-binding EF-hand superfamily protein